MKVLLFLCLCVILSVVMAEQGPVLGKNPCTYGPSYWCKNAQTIAQCHAEVYCSKHPTTSADLEA